MPVMPCKKDGKSGHKCGSGGGCITESKDGRSTWERACASCTAQGKECSDDSSIDRSIEPFLELINSRL